MGLYNFQIQRLGRALAKMIRPRPIVGQTPKMALLRPEPGQAGPGPGPGPNSSLVQHLIILRTECLRVRWDNFSFLEASLLLKKCSLWRFSKSSGVYSDEEKMLVLEGEQEDRGSTYILNDCCVGEWHCHTGMVLIKWNIHISQESHKSYNAGSLPSM